MKLRIPTLLLWAATSASTGYTDGFPQNHIQARYQSAKAQIAVDPYALEPGQVMTIEYIGQPVWVYRRTEDDINYLRSKMLGFLADPAGANWQSSIFAAHRTSTAIVWARVLLGNQAAFEKTPYRSLKEEFMIFGAWGSHTGCSLQIMDPRKRPVAWAPFFDPCAGGAWFDVAGRVLKKGIVGPLGPARQHTSYNLFIPPHRYTSESKLVIGLAPDTELPDVQQLFRPDYSNKSPNERIITAAANNDLPGVLSALQDGAEADFNVPGLGSSFDAAIVGGSMDIVDLLVSKGACPTPNSRQAVHLVDRPHLLKLISRLERVCKPPH